MADHDDAPLSSYSDPIYDRIDSFFRAFKRNWWIYALGLAVVIAGAIFLRSQRQTDPLALSATAMVDAENLEDPAKREAALAKIADDAGGAPFFRASACIELAQLALDRADHLKAGERATQAEAHAKAAGDDDLQYAAVLSQASVAHQAGRLDDALALYEKTARAAGAKHPVRKLDADLGAARILAAQGKTEDAIARLEPLTTRADRGADELLQVARATYWKLKRGDQPQPAEAPKAAEPAAPAPAIP